MMACFNFNAVPTFVGNLFLNLFSMTTNGSPESRFSKNLNTESRAKLVSISTLEGNDVIKAFETLPSPVKQLLEKQLVEGQITERSDVIKRQIARVLGTVEVPQFEHTSVSAAKHRTTEKPRFEDAGGHHVG